MILNSSMIDKKIESILLILISIFFLFLSFYFINSFHNFGADFSQYIQHAINISHGVSYDTQVTVNEIAFSFSSLNDDTPNMYPPLLPWVLSFLYEIFGFDIKTFKVYNILALLLMGYACYLYFSVENQKKFSIIALIIVLFSIPLFRFQNFILSDLLFACLFTWSILFYRKYEIQNNYLSLIAFLIFASAATLTKSIGLILFLSALTLGAIKLKMKHVLIIFLISVVFLFYTRGFLFSSVDGVHWFNDGSNSLDFNFANESIDEKLYSIFLSFSVLCEIFFYNPLHLLKSYGGVLGHLSNSLVSFFIITLYILFKFRNNSNKKSKFDKFLLIVKKINFVDVVFFYYFFFVMVFLLDIIIGEAAHHRRYYFPLVLPMLYFLFYVGGYLLPIMQEKFSVGSFKYAIYIALSSFVIANILFVFNYKSPESTNGAFTGPTVEIYEYIKKNTNEEDIIIFRKPRLMSLMTMRRSVKKIDFLEKNLDIQQGEIWIVDNTKGRLETNYIHNGKIENYEDLINSNFVYSEEVFRNQWFKIFKTDWL